mmetsp:Transcript_25020/g.35041  ORF Transcript_25020/g.35041 Transcript_25020/m.35041 type:complete len:157 (-) Transcript_25020:59-529(-)|eukprot:CAMPEP_0168547624 /NCGR_PEP_ID=MMETSP0413-20121227/4135_1 /TAXON_ID=136452 /ORGANISM="Filamoeba nolandi, Strain NC-AS-23-1" /LENGTH=156 /DNA_ID=CAMNT_0008577889 /DNA_START=55 /DNA_END=525 /DNA_ORIENTATION=+
MEVQTERAFQKQSAVFVASKRILGKKKSKGLRYYKNIGLGYKTPKEAISGNYIDKKCPFTGNVSIRGRILKGIVVSTKMKRTIVIRRDYLHYIRKYDRFEKRHRNVSAHCSPAFKLKEGDIVTIGQCRPLSKTVRFNVIKVEPQKVTGSGKQFRLF